MVGRNTTIKYLIETKEKLSNKILNANIDSEDLAEILNQEQIIDKAIKIVRACIDE